MRIYVAAFDSVLSLLDYIEMTAFKALDEPGRTWSSWPS